MNGKKQMVREMFDDISPRYDFLNHFLSFGTDFHWRAKFVRMLAKHHPDIILDIATGTGDLAIAMMKIKPEKVIGMDISEKMLEVGKRKIKLKNLDQMIELKKGDAENLPFPDETFDAVTVAFGVRNYEDLEKGLSEMRRILKPGGVMQILEFSKPGSAIVRGFYGLYSAIVIPLAGKIISGNKNAYTYLPESVAAFPSGNQFLEIMKKTGMNNLVHTPLTFGIASVYSGIK
ncbi:MAG: bifunctional demethylmenaquinone methyltransferase/2-methoxy-6-polyprenyl-1,4-benzoquinol methylase UbiE [Syntrophothermus sp.]